MGIATTAGMGATAAGSLMELLRAAEVADEEGQGRLYGSQLLTCCRMLGVEESSAMLRTMVNACQEADGKVDYVRFVQQLAAQRASNNARMSVEQLREMMGQMGYKAPAE